MNLAKTQYDYVDSVSWFVLISTVNKTKGKVKKTRREFLKKSAFIAAGASTLPLINLGCAASKQASSKEIGVQLWSVRELLEQNFEEAIAKVAEIGFDYVESFGLSPTGIFPGLITANQYERTVASTGMRIASSHSSYFQSEEAPIVIESAERLGVDWAIIAWLSEEHRSDYYTVAENLNAIGEQFKDAGIGFGYHNHDFEFIETEEGEIPLEILLENTDPELVSFQADLYWVIKSGFDPLEVIQKYPGRFCSYHVKDANEALEQTTVGTGIIDFASILAENATTGIQYVFVEDERTEDPLLNIGNGLKFLRNLDY